MSFFPKRFLKDFGHKFDPRSSRNSKPANMTIIDQIKNNSITSIYLTHEDEEVIDKCSQAAEALAENTSLLSVRLGDEFLGCLRRDSRADIINAISKMQNLQELHIEDALVSIADIAGLVAKVQGLKVLALKNVVLQGIQSDFDAGERALHQHPSLKDFKMEDCRPANSEIDTKSLKLGAQSGIVAGGSLTDDSGQAVLNPAA